ncbi:MAG TPA: VCBS repeat-containing protein, partial [Gemmatimonadales bacterium]
MGYRWRTLATPPRGTPGFTSLLPNRTGVTFTNTVRDSLILANRILVQGGGVALGDVDQDGLVDVYLCRTDGPNALYRNRGDWRFEDITTAAGVAARDRYSTGATLADIDGDGDLDLLVLALGGPNAWFINDGTGRFTEQQLPDRAGSTTAALADVDRDGDLDVFIANYKAYTTLDSLPPQVRAFDQLAREIAPRRFEILPQYTRDYRVVPREDLRGVSIVQRADPDFFYLYQGGVFERIPFVSDRFRDEEGKPLSYEPESFGLAAMFADVDRDGDPDLYIANDFEDPDEF